LVEHALAVVFFWGMVFTPANFNSADAAHALENVMGATEMAKIETSERKNITTPD
jgi:hypothetical protein